MKELIRFCICCLLLRMRGVFCLSEHWKIQLVQGSSWPFSINLNIGIAFIYFRFSWNLSLLLFFPAIWGFEKYKYKLHFMAGFINPAWMATPAGPHGFKTPQTKRKSKKLPLYRQVRWKLGSMICKWWTEWPCDKIHTFCTKIRQITNPKLARG